MGRCERKETDDVTREEENEKATKDFIEKVLFILFAKLFELLYSKIILFVVYGNEGHFTAAQKIKMKTIHVACAVAIFPAVGYILSGQAVAGTSLWKDALKLIGGSSPMVISWGFRELAHDFCIYVGNHFWQKFLLAFVCTVVLVIAEVTPCYKRSKAAVAAGGKQDSLLARYIMIPVLLGLAIGSLWNGCATWGVHYMQSRTENLFYWMSWQLLSTFIIGVATTISNEVLSQRMASAIAEEKHQQSGPRQEESMRRLSYLATEIDVHWMETAITVTSYLYGWAIIDSLDCLYFSICFDCLTPVGCSFQTNLGFSLITTFIFCKVVCILTHVRKTMDNNDQIATALQMKGLTLCVGWAWTNFVVTFDQYAISGEETVGDQIKMNIILFLEAAVISITIYHIACRAARGSVKQRESLKFDIVGEVGSVACQTIGTKVAI